MKAMEIGPGLQHWPGFLSRADQQSIVKICRAILRAAPLFTPSMPRTGKPLSVRMTNCGELGWVTDREKGYRYQATHPVTGEPWPPIPEMLIEIWRQLTGLPILPEACLINYYGANARMGLHQDRDEDTYDFPVLSLSLGDSCVFRFGGQSRCEPTRSIRLNSGDALMMHGPGRLAFHGVDRILVGSSSLLAKAGAESDRQGGRINLTLRRVTPPG